VHANTRAGLPYNTDATAAPNGGHPISIVVTDDTTIVADLGNAGRPLAVTDLLGRKPRIPLDNRVHTGNDGSFVLDHSAPATLGDQMAVSGQSLLAGRGQMLVAADTPGAVPWPSVGRMA
jgi:hypothetical protein